MVHTFQNPITKNRWKALNRINSFDSVFSATVNLPRSCCKSTVGIDSQSSGSCKYLFKMMISILRTYRNLVLLLSRLRFSHFEWYEKYLSRWMHHTSGEYSCLSSNGHCNHEHLYGYYSLCLTSSVNQDFLWFIQEERWTFSTGTNFANAVSEFTILYSSLRSKCTVPAANQSNIRAISLVIKSKSYAINSSFLFSSISLKK